MALDLKIEIFAYDLFQHLFHFTDLLPEMSKVSLRYDEEYDRDPDYEEVCRNEHIKTVLCRTFFFQGIYREEVVDNSAKFVSSQSDFCEYFLGVCQATNLFAGLSVFERVFATCGFLYVLCWECCKSGFRDCLQFAYSCWAMYFDKYSNEFYNQGGWLKLSAVALSYVLLFDIILDKRYETSRVCINKLSSAVQNYYLFRQCQQFLSGTCSKKWIKFHVQNYNKTDGANFYRSEVNFSSKEELEELLLNIRLRLYPCQVPTQQADVPLQLHQEWPCEENLNFCASSSSSHSDIYTKFQSVSSFLDRERACTELIDVHLASHFRQSLNLGEGNIGPITESVPDANTLELSPLSIDKEMTRLGDETCENKNKQQKENIDYLANMTLDHKMSSRTNSVRFDDPPHLPALFKEIAKFSDIDRASREQSSRLEPKSPANPFDATHSVLEGSFKYTAGQDCETNCKQLADKCTHSMEGLSEVEKSESKTDKNTVSPTASSPQQVEPSEVGGAAKKKKKRKNANSKKPKSQTEQESGTLGRIPCNVFTSPAMDELKKNVTFEPLSSPATADKLVGSLIDLPVTAEYVEPKQNALPADNGSSSSASHSDIITQLQSIADTLNRELTTVTEALNVCLSSHVSQSLNIEEEIVGPIEEGILETNTLVLSLRSIRKEMTRLHDVTREDQSKQKQEKIQIIEDVTLEQKEKMLPVTDSVKCNEKLDKPALFKETAKSFDIDLVAAHQSSQLTPKSSRTNPFDANDFILEECVTDEKDCEMNCKQLGDECTEKKTIGGLLEGKMSESTHTRKVPQSASTSQQVASSETGSADKKKKKRKNAKSKKHNPQTEQESEDVIDLLRMSLVLGDKVGIRHVCSTLQSSDKTQSKN